MVRLLKSVKLFMLPFENMVDEYIEKTGNNVMYRVTPVFKGNNLVADGVLTIGKNSRIGSGASVICNGGRVEIGDFTGSTG